MDYVESLIRRIDTLEARLSKLEKIETPIIYKTTGAPTNGTSGTYAGVAPIGSLLVNTSDGALYSNTGTLASPTWTAR